ncbi:MAG: Ig-like domain-containing protein, partial [Treponema sp.]|nr:Ig-like domain-containing protein [Treponema sp.]
MKKICVGLLILCSFTAGCHQDPQEVKEKISSIEFDVESVEVNVNEDVIVRVTAKSDEAKKNESIKYTSVNEGFVEIREASNDGFIVKGLKAGSTIIRAQSQNVDKLLEVKVYGEDVLARYIKLSKPVIEVEEGMLVQTSVSLYGRVTEPDDNSLFQWQLETGKNNIAVNAAANIAVIKGLERGYQEINISHPRASFGNKILVFVKGVDEVIQYIYRDSNVLVIDNDGQYHDFDVVLINGEPSDAVDFTYEVVDGKENIQEISGAQTKCNVLAQKGGLSTIRVSHPKAAVDFDVRVVINEPDMPYITLDNSFLLFNVLESERVTAEVKYARNGIAHKSQFSFKILENNAEVQKENSIIEVIQTNESFYIRAKNAGTARVVISNEQAETPREVLVVVREEAVYRDDYYISINQNVITTQVGAEMTRLNARLVNGISADANNMIWDVDDSTVIKLITNHGTVRSRAAVQQVFEAFANIEPLKAGTAKITITNTKWPDTLAQVIVRVYPKGTFAEPPLRIGGDGLIKLEYPQQETIQLRVTEGDESKIKNNLLWEVTPSGIAAFPMPGLQGLTNIMQAAVGAGSLEPAGALGKLTVTGGGIEAPHEAIVMAGNEAYLNSISVIYVDNVYQKVVEQQTIDVHVLNSKTNAQGKPDESWQPTLFTAAVEKPNIAYAVMVQNVLKIMGKERGETDIVVRHSGAVNESITIHLRVEPAYIS